MEEKTVLALGFFSFMLLIAALIVWGIVASYPEYQFNKEKVRILKQMSKDRDFKNDALITLLK